MTLSMAEPKCSGNFIPINLKFIELIKKLETNLRGQNENMEGAVNITAPNGGIKKE